MEFSDLIKTPKVDVVVMNTHQGKPVEVSLHVSSHHLILSARKEGVEELWVRNIEWIKSYVNTIKFCS
jgi:myotubularin-related protein 9